MISWVPGELSDSIDFYSDFDNIRSDTVIIFVILQSLPNVHEHQNFQSIWLQPILLIVPLIQPMACVELLKKLHIRTSVLIKYLTTAR